MLIKTTLISISLFFGNVLAAQTGTLIDKRDGNLYQTIQIGNKTWLREHLRFVTRSSYFPNVKGDTIGLYLGNYYSNNEVDSVCPKGWHLATIDELEEYIQAIKQLYSYPDSMVEHTISPHRDSSFRITIKGFDPMSDTLLRLYSIGWVEGKKIHLDKSLSLWLNDTKYFDNKFHAHIGKLGYIIHTHEHNIIDKPKNIRKFPVRCVCDRY